MRVATDRTDDYVISMEGVEDDLRVAKEDHDADWYWQPNVLIPLVPSPQALAGEGVIVEALATDPPPGCEGRLERYRERSEPGPA